MAEEKEDTVDLESLTRKELEEEAKARGIDTKGMKTKTDIIDAIGEYEEGSGETPEKKDEAPKEPAPKVSVKGVPNIKGPVDVLDDEGNYIRTYSEELHGKDYKKLAVQFVEKPTNRGARIVPSKEK